MEIAAYSQTVEAFPERLCSWSGSSAPNACHPGALQPLLKAAAVYLSPQIERNISC